MIYDLAVLRYEEPRSTSSTISCISSTVIILLSKSFSARFSTFIVSFFASLSLNSSFAIPAFAIAFVIFIASNLARCPSLFLILFRIMYYPHFLLYKHNILWSKDTSNTIYCQGQFLTGCDILGKKH